MDVPARARVSGLCSACSFYLSARQGSVGEGEKPGCRLTEAESNSQGVPPPPFVVYSALHASIHQVSSGEPIPLPVGCSLSPPPLLNALSGPSASPRIALLACARPGQWLPTASLVVPGRGAERSRGDRKNQVKRLARTRTYDPFHVVGLALLALIMFVAPPETTPPNPA